MLQSYTNFTIVNLVCMSNIIIGILILFCCNEYTAPHYTVMQGHAHIPWLIPAGFVVTLIGVYFILRYKEARLPAPPSPLSAIATGEELNTPSRVSCATIYYSMVLEVDNNIIRKQLLAQLEVHIFA